jgi:hypothetical protein
MNTYVRTTPTRHNMRTRHTIMQSGGYEESGPSASPTPPTMAHELTTKEFEEQLARFIGYKGQPIPWPEHRWKLDRNCASWEKLSHSTDTDDTEFGPWKCWWCDGQMSEFMGLYGTLRECYCHGQTHMHIVCYRKHRRANQMEWASWVRACVRARAPTTGLAEEQQPSQPGVAQHAHTWSDNGDKSDNGGNCDKSDKSDNGDKRECDVIDAGETSVDDKLRETFGSLRTCSPEGVPQAENILCIDATAKSSSSRGRAPFKAAPTARPTLSTSEFACLAKAAPTHRPVPFAGAGTFAGAGPGKAPPPIFREFTGAGPGKAPPPIF